MAITLIQNAFGNLDEVVEGAIASTSSGWVAGLVEVASAGMFLYILVYGYMVLAGKIQAPVTELFWQGGRIVLIMAFVTNAGDLLTASQHAIEGLRDFLANGSAAGSNASWQVAMDARLAKIVKQIATAWQNAGSGVGGYVVGFILVLSDIPLLLGYALVTLEIMLSYLSLTLLSVTAPLFIFCLMYGFLKNMFSQWLGAIISNCLKILFMSVSLDIGATLLNNTGQIDVTSQNWFEPMLIYLLGGIVIIGAAHFGKELSEKLSQVSIEGISKTTPMYMRDLAGGGSKMANATAKTVMKQMGGVWGKAAGHALDKAAKKKDSL